jgi:O-antigen ligase
MALWLLRIANSATSLACTFVGIGIYVITGIRFVKPTLRYVEVYGAVGAVLWWLADSVLHLTELVVTGLGRDMTLTTRTDAWQLFLSIDLNPLIGAGFKSFWAGERMARIWQDFPGIVQAHNGYIETYLEGGVLGLTFLAILMLAAFRAIKRSLVAGDDYARIRLAFWFVAVAYNFTEAAYTQLSLLWIVTLLIVTEGCEVAVAVSATKDVPPLDRPIRIQSPWRSAGPTAIRRQTKTVERSLS